METHIDTTYRLEPSDQVCVTPFHDGTVGLHSFQSFRIDFSPEHIPILEKLIAALVLKRDAGPGAEKEARSALDMAERTEA
jgi:hypothetical protein